MIESGRKRKADRPTESRRRETRLWQVHLTAAAEMLLLLLVGFLGVEKSVDGVYTEQPLASVVVGEIQASVTVGQTFIAEYDGLSRVEVYLATYARHNTGPLVFHLRADPCSGADLVTATFDAEEVADNSYHVFEFSPIRSSGGCLYCFFLEAPEATPGNAITVWGAREDAYAEGEAILDGLGERRVHDLTFRLGYELTALDKVAVFLERLAVNKPSLWGDERLYVFLGVAYLVLLYVTLAWIAQT